MPDGYTSWEYLQKLCFDGLKERYPGSPQELVDRLGYELETIRTMGYVDYFLIVWDFIKYARDHEIMVGAGAWNPRRAGIVAYCLGIHEY